jgi:selenocysteine lyase/cysteine desulfurase
VLAEVDGVRVVTPPGSAGLVAFTLAGADPPSVCRALAARGVAIRWIDVPPLLRLSAGFFTDEGDLRLLAEGLSDPVVAGAGTGADG